MRVPSTDLLSRRQRAAIVALLFGAVYFSTEGLAELFNAGKPYLKLLKHVDMRLPIEWAFWFAETLGLYHPVYVIGVGERSFFAELRTVALGTLVYIALGYILGFLLPLSRTPHSNEERDR